MKVHSTREPTPEELKQHKTLAKRKKKKTERPTVVINAKGMVDEWGWVLKTPGDLERDTQEQLRITKAIEGKKIQDPKEAEKMEEWGHLNVQR